MTWLLTSDRSVAHYVTRGGEGLCGSCPHGDPWDVARDVGTVPLCHECRELIAVAVATIAESDPPPVGECTCAACRGAKR